MKTLIICALFAGLNFIATAQAFQWSVYDKFENVPTIGTHVCIDSDDNLYVLGKYYRGGTHGDSTLAGTFLNKYSVSGVLLWRKQFPNSGMPTLACDGDNNILVTGGIGFTTTVNSLMKFDQSGNLIKSVPITSEVYTRITDFKIDKNNNYYLLGTYQHTLNIGGFTFVNNQSGTARLFIAKFNSLDSCLWVKSASAGSIYTLKLAIDKYGNLYAGGLFSGSLSNNMMSFGTVTLNTTSMSGFVMKTNSDGDLSWLKKIEPKVQAIDVDTSGNVYIGGNYGNDFQVNSTWLTVEPSKLNIYLIKMNGSGGFEWAKQMGGTGMEILSGISVGPYQNVYVTGAFEDQSNFGTISLSSNSTMQASPYPYNEPFVANHSAVGDILWAVKAGMNVNEYGYTRAITTDQRGNIFITGQVNENMYSAKIENSLPVGLKPNTEILTNINIYPNPGSEKIKLSFYSVKKQIVEIKITDAIGKIFLSQSIAVSEGNHVKEIDLSGLLKGFYTLEFRNNSKSVTKKIVIN